MKQKIITIGQAASILGISIKTLRRWDKSGRLKAIRIGGESSDRKYYSSDIQKLLKKLNQPGLDTDNISTNKERDWLNNREQKIWRYLTDFNIEASKAYAGAIRSIKNSDNPDWISQAAHSAREVIKILAYRETPGTKKIDNVIDFKNSEDLLGHMPSENLYNAARQWVDLYNWFANVSHHTQKTNKDELIKKFKILEVILESQIGPFYFSLQKVDRLIKKANPNIEDANQLVALLQKQSHIDYFFKKISNPEWLTLLDKVGYFKKPPKIIIENDYIRFPTWPQGLYLIKTCQLKPKEISEIVDNSLHTDNPIVHDVYIDIALLLPIEFSILLIKKIKKEKWLYDSSFHTFSDKYTKLIIRLIENKKPKYAKDLFIELMEVKKKESIIPGLGENGGDHKDIEAISCISEWDYEQSLSEIVPKFAESYPLFFIKTLKDLLIKCIELKTDKKGDFSNDGYLHLHREEIKTEGRFHSRKPCNLLISAIKNVVDVVGKNQPTRLKAAVDLLQDGKETYSIFCRFKMYILSTYPSFFDIEIDVLPLIVDKKNFDNFDKKREYLDLLKVFFILIPSKDQKTVLKWVANLSSKYSKICLLDTLSLHLKGRLKKEYDSFKKSGAIFQLSEARKHKGVWSGPTSIISKEALAKLSVEQVINYIRKWMPDINSEFNSPSPEGLGRVLEEIVNTDTKEWCLQGIKIFKAKLRPVYLYYILKGLEKGVNEEKEIHWKILLDLLDLLTVTKEPYKYKDDEGYFSETGWPGVRKSVSDIIYNGLRPGKSSIPFVLKEKVWIILDRLTSDPDPSLDFEREHLTESTSPATLAINTTRGQSFHALIQYSLWISRNLNNRKILTLEVKKLLEKHLDPKYDPSLTSISVYGQFFTQLFWLDKKWTRKTIKWIFPLPFDGERCQSSWSAYIEWATFWIPAAKSLLPIYVRASKHLKLSSIKYYDDRLAEHLMILYWRGEISLTHPALTNFYLNASENARAHSIWSIWKSLDEIKPKRISKEWKRIKELWQFRVKNISQLVGPSDEISTFLEWLPSVPEDIDTMYDLINRTIPHCSKGIETKFLINYLQKNMKINLKKVVQLLYRLSLLDIEHLTYGFEVEDSSEILKEGLRSKSNEIKEITRKIINSLLERGVYDFSSLLKT